MTFIMLINLLYFMTLMQTVQLYYFETFMQLTAPFYSIVVFANLSFRDDL